ncbi:MAG: iron ABC transporter permease, partial [Bacteroidota bacterium]|nr:iron ABC transporter permease [Bacteroidota bacterium]
MKQRYLHWTMLLVVLILLLIVAALWSLTTGEIHISLGHLADVFSQSDSLEKAILTQIRIPRLVLAFSIGGTLSLVGAILQGVFRNPLVEPYTLGISGGASLGVAIVIVLGTGLMGHLLTLPIAGFAGSLVTILLVYFLGMRRGTGNVNRMLLIGVMISFISSSALMLLMSVGTTEDMHTIVFWTMGSLDEPNLQLIRLVFWTSLIGLLVTNLFAPQLNALRLGETKAMHLGVNAPLVIRLMFLITSLLTGICVAVGGVIGFVGLVIPHMIRQVAGSDFRILLTGSFLGGAL